VCVCALSASVCVCVLCLLVCVCVVFCPLVCVCVCALSASVRVCVFCPLVRVPYSMFDCAMSFRNVLCCVVCYVMTYCIALHCIVLGTVLCTMW
jgi:hypothetical protein